jgi:hypothetical protein
MNFKTIAFLTLEEKISQLGHTSDAIERLEIVQPSSDTRKIAGVNTGFSIASAKVLPN